jgi:hypothetical protein
VEGLQTLAVEFNFVCKHKRYFLRNPSRLNYLGTYRLLKGQHNPGIHFGTFDAGHTPVGSARL